MPLPNARSLGSWSGPPPQTGASPRPAQSPARSCGGGGVRAGSRVRFQLQVIVDSAVAARRGPSAGKSRPPAALRLPRPRLPPAVPGRLAHGADAGPRAAVCVRERPALGFARSLFHAPPEMLVKEPLNRAGSFSFGTRQGVLPPHKAVHDAGLRARAAALPPCRRPGPRRRGALRGGRDGGQTPARPRECPARGTPLAEKPASCTRIVVGRVNTAPSIPGAPRGLVPTLTDPRFLNRSLLLLPMRQLGSTSSSLGARHTSKEALTT